MKKIFSLLPMVVLNFATFAQSAKTSLLFDFVASQKQSRSSFTQAVLFDPSKTSFLTGDKIIARATRLVLNKQGVSDIFEKKPANLSLSLPVDQNNSIQLLLAATQLNSSNDFAFGTLSGDNKTTTSVDEGLHYRGYISGDSNSLACISLFKNGEVMGVFANKDGNYTIGRMKNSDDQYVLYRNDDMFIQPRYPCDASELSYPAARRNDQTIAAKPLDAPPVLCKKVRIYWEGDYHLYSYNFGSDLTKTQNYLTGLFNVVATIYQNEGIMLELSKTYVWTSTDPYTNGNSTQGLNSFKSYWNGLGDNYDGDLAHLVAGGTTNNGGLGFILNFDQCNRPYTYGYSNIYANFQAYPNYSWDAQAVTHETGHNLGSNHTHWCGWNTGAGNTCGAIDNCNAFDAGAGCTSCFTQTDINNPPAGFKGTIMSYCYLKNGIGVSFVNGFGPLPQAVIRNNVSSAACFTKRNFWTGTISTAWEEAGNWSCGSLPDATTDVSIASGLKNYPVINSQATCRSIKESQGASLKVNTNFRLTVAGKPGN